MRSTKTAWIVAICFTLGVAVGVGAAKVKVDPGLFTGGDKGATGEALLDLARRQTEDGTWERIALGRVYYLAGHKEEGEALFEAATSGKKVDASDWIRIGRVYWEAGEWDRARELFERVVAEAPKDEDWLAEIGAFYNLQGDQARAEELFRKSFTLEPDRRKNTLRVAGSYLGVRPD